MIYPTRDKFIQKTKKGNLVPVYKKLLGDMETPVSAYIKIAKGNYSFLLESVEGGEKIGRFSIMGRNPLIVFSAKGKKITIQEGQEKTRYVAHENPIQELKKVMNQFRYVSDPGLPRFDGGAVGYIGYGMVNYFDQIPQKNNDPLKMPDLYFMICDAFLIFDHVEHTIQIVANAYIQDDSEKAYDKAIQRIIELEKDLKRSIKKKPLALKESSVPLNIKSNLSESEFKTIVEKAKEYIYEGDIFQVVLSQRFEADVRGEPLDYYRALRSINPSPYMFLLKFNQFYMVGTSPEILVRYEFGQVEVRPIAGTRPRGKDEKEDADHEKSLLDDPKERAEHVMLVDLGRNDIGRVSKFGSVQVKDFMMIEKYSHVMHIVSDVMGQIKENEDSFSVLEATFPAGTVSGAPKIRAMQIIEELENIARGPYAGAVGFFSFSGTTDTCITIRTILFYKGKAYIQVGAGIVADSIPANEYTETVNKALGMMKAIRMVEGGLDASRD